MNDKPYSWLLTPAMAEEFFLRCLKKEANTKVERISILKELVFESKAKELTKSETEDKIRNKKVLIIKNKRKNNEKTN